MKSLLVTFVAILSTLGNLSHADDSLRSGFENPPASAKARTWWHWINGNVSKVGITADLEAMKKVGIQEVQIFNVDLKDPRGPVTYLSPQWLDLFKHAATESKRLGLELGFHNGPGWSSSGGPWVTPEHAMQNVVFSTTEHQGGAPFRAELPQPSTLLDYYRDIAVLAFPTPKTKQRIENLDYKNLSGRIRNHLAPDTKVIPASAIVSSSEIVDLTDFCTADGVLKWDAPEGEWTILRIGHTPNGRRNRPAPLEGSGLECDKMSRVAVDAYWQGGIRPILKKLGPLVGPVLNNCVIDSYEVGTANWTPGFDTAFEKLRSYQCKPFLPALAGYYVDSGEITERFLWDFRRTIGDMIAKNYYAYFRELCHEHGMKLSIEPYWGPFDNMQVGQHGDIVMCEFWSGEVAFFDSPKFVASIAKLNGDPIVGAEAFTGEGGWIEHPATIKSIGDRAWAQGINRFIFHSYVHQPWDVGPGLTLSYHGLEFNRLNTWWDQGSAFLDYVSRSQFLLQQGQSVADVLVFVGEASPNDALLMPEIKAMGYDYDLIGANKLSSLTVKDGLIHTSTGGTYRALVLPQTTWIRPETLKRFGALAEAGATVLGPKPLKSPSLQGFPECDVQVSRLAEKLWSTGTIKDGSIVELLSGDSIPPDFSGETGMSADIAFIHRKSTTDDIYFLASSQKESRRERCRFRVKGKRPEIWNAETGEIKDAAQWQANADGTTSVPIEFDAEGSVFVVFRQPAAGTTHIVKTTMAIERPPVALLPNLKIIDAQYGTFLPAGLADVTQTLAEAVKDNRLDVIANRKLLDCDPAPGYVKELRLKYEIAGTPDEIHVEEREAIKINAAGEGKLKIVKAVFGKFAKGIVGLPADTSSLDITEKIESLVAAGIPEIPVDNELGVGLPAQTNRTELQITYSIDGQLQKRSISAGETFKLSQEVPGPILVNQARDAYWLTPSVGKMTYSTSSGQTKTVHVETVPDSIKLSGPWNVSFPAKPGTIIDTKFDNLSSWTASNDQKIRYFSGTGIYKKTFELPPHLLHPGISLELDLGNVQVIADVVINGKKVRTLWKRPFRVSLDGVVKEGANQLEIKVTNLWPNRLIGDQQLPSDTRRRGKNVKHWPDWLLNQTPRASRRVAFPAYQHWEKDSPLQPSGLLGPVIIRPYVRVKVSK